MRQFLVVDMRAGKVSYEAAPAACAHLGGRALSDALVSDLVPARCDPLGSENVLVLVPGIVTGTTAPSSGRLSVGGKSPLTGGIKEANAGGLPGQKIARLGLQAIVVQGQAEPSSGPYLLLVNAGSAQLIAAPELSGLGTYELARTLWDRYDKVGVISIGPAGERRASAAGISCNDPQNGAGRFAARGALGALMGSKGLKAIVVDDRDGPGVTLHDPATFDRARRVLAKALNTHPSVVDSLRPLGTAGILQFISDMGTLPTRNFRSGQFDGASKVTGDVISRWVQERGGAGRVGEACHPGCVIRCSNVVAHPEGSYHVAPLEYESIWAFGPNLGIDDLDAIAEMTYLANDLGLDSMDLGSAVAIAMEARWLEFGDADGAIALLREIYAPTERGALLMQGTAHMAEALGVERCPTVKRQSMAAYDPRAIKGMGTVYASCPMGADHTAGYTVFTELDDKDVNYRWSTDKADLARTTQARTMFLDTAGYCTFIGSTVDSDPQLYQAMLDTVNACCGSSYTADHVLDQALAWLRAEVAFNRAAGLASQDDRLPEFMSREPLPPHNTTWDVPGSEIDAVFQA